MIGSLKQFIGQINQKEFFSKHRQSPKSRSHRDFTFHHLQHGNKDNTQCQSNIHNQPCPPTLTPNNQCLIKTKMSNQDLPREAWSHVIDQLLKITLPPQTQKNRVSVKDYVAQDKSILLNNYDKHIKRLKNRKQDSSQPMNTNHIPLVSTNRDNQDRQYHRIKGKLSQKHQILRSIVRVDEIDTTAIKTFFEISFERVNEQLNKLRQKDIDRGQPFKIKTVFTPRRKEENLHMLSQRNTSNAFYNKINEKMKTQQNDSKRKYSLNSSRKWNTGKSAQPTQQSQNHSPSITTNRFKTLETSRHSILKRIKEIVTNPKRPCRRIINHN